MRTPVRNIRVSDELWDAAAAAAEREGTTPSAVVNAALRKYVKRHRPPPVGESEQAKRKKIRAVVAAFPALTPADAEQLLTLLRD